MNAAKRSSRTRNVGFLLGIALLLVKLISGSVWASQENTPPPPPEAPGSSVSEPAADETGTGGGEDPSAALNTDPEDSEQRVDPPRHPEEEDNPLALEQRTEVLETQIRRLWVVVVLTLLLLLFGLFWSLRADLIPLLDRLRGPRRRGRLLPTGGQRSSREAEDTVDRDKPEVQAGSAPESVNSSPSRQQPSPSWQPSNAPPSRFSEPSSAATPLSAPPLSQEPSSTVKRAQRAAAEPQLKPNLEPSPPSAPPARIEQSRASGPQTPPEAELESLHQGAIAVALVRLHDAAPQLAAGFQPVQHQEATRFLLEERLAQALRRFREQAVKGEGVLRADWVAHDLVSILDGLAQLLSAAIEERRQGRGGRQRVEDALQQWLYERLAPICRKEGWFEVEPILPYATQFNPRIHTSIGSKPVPGAENLVIAIRSVGRRDPHSREMLHLAEVMVGC